MQIPIAESKGLPSDQAGRVFSLGGEKKTPQQIPRTGEEVWGEVRKLGDKAVDMSVKLTDMRNAKISDQAVRELKEGTLAIMKDIKHNHKKYGVKDTDFHEESFNEQYGKLRNSIESKYVGNARVGEYMENHFSDTKVRSLPEVHKFGWARELDQARAGYVETEKAMMNVYLDPDTPDSAKQDIIKTHQMSTNAAVSAGYINEKEAFGFHETFVNGASKAFWKREVFDNPIGAFKQLTEDPPDSFKNLDEAEQATILQTAETNADRATMNIATTDIKEDPEGTYLKMKENVMPTGYEKLDKEEKRRVDVSAEIAYNSAVRDRWIVDMIDEPKETYNRWKLEKDSKEMGYLKGSVQREIGARAKAAYDKAVRDEEVTYLYEKARKNMAGGMNYEDAIDETMKDDTTRAQSRSSAATMLRTSESRDITRKNNALTKAKAEEKTRIFNLHLANKPDAAIAAVNEAGSPLTGEEKFDMLEKIKISPEDYKTNDKYYGALAVKIANGDESVDTPQEILNLISMKKDEELDMQGADKLVAKLKEFKDRSENYPSYKDDVKFGLGSARDLFFSKNPKKSDAMNATDVNAFEAYMLRKYEDAITKKRLDTKDQTAILTREEMLHINDETILVDTFEQVRPFWWDTDRSDWERYKRERDDLLQGETPPKFKTLIPQALRDRYIRVLKQAGKPVTEQMITELHNAQSGRPEEEGSF